MKPLILFTPPSLADREHQLQPYIDALEAAGARTEMIPLSLPLTEVTATLRRADGLLLIGGGDLDATNHERSLSPTELATLTHCSPVLDALERQLVRTTAESNLPTLAICRGLQIVNWALGGTLLPDIKLRHPQSLLHQHADPLALAHRVAWRPETRLGRLLANDCPQVTSTHHQAVDRLATGLVVAATAADGIVEAVEKPTARFFCGVQFHPERMTETSAGARKLFEEFVRLASQTHR